MEKNFMSELTLRDIARALFRQKYVIIITFIIITAGTFIGLKMQTPVYQATVKMYIKGVSHTEALTYENLGGFRIHLTQMEIVHSEPVLRRVVSTLKLDERPLDYEKYYSSILKRPLIDFFAKKEMEELDKLGFAQKKEVMFYNALKELKANIITSLKPNTDIFYITATDYDPDMAVAIANVVSRAYTIFDQQQQLTEMSLKYGNLHPVVQQLQDNIFRMDQNLSGERLPDLEAIGTASVKIIEQATTDGFPVGKPKILILIMSFFVSGFIGVALALFFDMIDQTFKSPDDLLKVVNIPVLGSIPKKRLSDKLFVKDADEPNRYTVFYEDLADQIYIFLKTQNIKTILVASPMQRELNSTIVPNLGYIFSRLLHHKTLIIDCNLRNPVYNTLLGINEVPGLANGIDNGRSSFDHIQKIDSDLDAISAGTSTMNPVTLLERFNINEILKDIIQEYEIVLLDCTNIKNFNDVVVLAPHADGVIIVVNEGRDRKQVVKSTISPLKNIKANVIGGILNNRTFKIPEVIYKRI
ncbi:MAG TPA: Wzz/FepE/Etk N-terminal domain-containing protein [Spirochaetota bacterium]|nr:Wzz/FepE/Etk N-terminal domain-containing protein [Spirochaetota bacterium]